MPTCEFLFDLGSPYSYLASTQIEALAKRTGATLQLTPVVLGGIFKALGGDQLPHALRLAWMRRDLALWTARYRIPLEFPASFPARTILGLRTIVAAGQGRTGAEQAATPAGAQRDDVRAMNALFAAFWGEGQDISAPEVVKAALDGAGLDGAALIAKAEDKTVKDALRVNTEQAMARGVFGAPTFFVGDTFYFGNDRLEFVEAALRAQD